ncbi:MAG: response regulator [Dehalococcoidales bacterium]|nr:response regulator [Dehalococcoidales bacterium]
MKIFVADTDNETIENVYSLLSSLKPDWQISASNSGKQCLSLLKESGCPDAILLGMLLCDMPGLDLIKQIRDDSDVPIMVLSHERDVRNMVAAFDAGASDYVIQPFNDQIFIARLKALIRRREWDTQAKKARAVNST